MEIYRNPWTDLKGREDFKKELVKMYIKEAQTRPKDFPSWIDRCETKGKGEIVYRDRMIKYLSFYLFTIIISIAFGWGSHVLYLKW